MVITCAPWVEEIRYGRITERVVKWESVFVVTVLVACRDDRVATSSAVGTRGRPVTEPAALLMRIVGGPSCWLGLR
jgi:hypothetical protein